MKNLSDEPSVAPCEKDALLIAAAVIAFFGVVALLAPAAQA